ncbi:guanyl-specific ribonuclease Sa [Paenibacillus jamilae]|jgi:guanyl-specific ribonuclease Sa|uniref:ribonuclease domain-containing protein n=1 Tax=Paenibacillus TaxID=44249 RepID=UPI000D3155AD|nr:MULTISPECIES: ribonuclease domain-containing protein [Paenibacillus]MDP9674606.1 guanyl-specific ribonuclease Sa [Paenibacillus jamilae]KAF6617130.1 ribonuclease [Paenibacillus sp. EKM101P]KAF6621932.1 ribonuclease [Paenibacillus sp. EKM102P]KAF6631517.1 ribonuclease [Paenibacillus sp. EKM10P]KAF6649956.1 ribonuclease [Paenibacillus sp. EKM11P]
MNVKKYLGVLLFILVTILFTGCSLQTVSLKDSTHSSSVLTQFDEVAKYISEHNDLPGNYITKKEARKLGWEPSEVNLEKVAPGKSIGGDVFRNREGLLPEKKGRIWYEADINYSGGTRGSDRILYSNDGLIYKTTDHYRTFEQLKE